ncbi:MAG TPA: hypothetical protein ENI81_06140 [Phycisphaerales bacterium]|nr:hypothetical protein [Phycisphaerales bacterium]
MRYEESLSPAEKALESALGQLKPAADRLNRDELMFNAGRAAAGGRAPWQALSGMLTVLLLGSILTRPASDGAPELTPPSQIQYQVAQVPDRPPQIESGGSLEYVTLRQKIVVQGLDALPVRRGAGSSEPRRNRRQLLESMLSS